MPVDAVVLRTQDPVFAGRATHRLGSERVTLRSRPLDDRTTEISVEAAHYSAARRLIDQMLADQPWRKLGRGERRLFIHAHRGWVTRIAAEVRCAASSVSNTWYGERTSRAVEDAITRHYRAVLHQEATATPTV